jgi:glucose-1-phosphate cytidylyltransferase
MVNVGPHPILWHIMNIYASHGFKEFVLALGYKGDVIKEYFLNYFALNSNFTVDLRSGKVSYEDAPGRDWRVSLTDTGDKSMTGGRLLRLRKLLEPHGTFMLTYGDGVADVNLRALLDFHRSHGKLVTVTAVHPSARFGGLSLEGSRVKSFKEKVQSGEGWINGGFFVMEPGVFEYLDGDSTILEKDPMDNLVKDGQLMAYQHSGFWQCMDTVRDRQLLEEYWSMGNAPWKTWQGE